MNQIKHTFVLALLALLAFAAPATAAPVAQISGTCALTTKENRGGLGATYTTSLKTSYYSCANGKALVKKFNKCRKKNGGAKGKCSGVGSFKCTERRSTIKTQFSSTTTCKSGKKKVVFKYTQFT